MGWNHDLSQVTKFVYWRSTCKLSVLNIDSKLDLRQQNKYVYWRSTYSPSLLNMCSKHVSCYVMKLVHWPSTFSLFVLNMRSKHDLRQHKFLRFCLCSFLDFSDLKCDLNTSLHLSLIHMYQNFRIFVC